MLKASPNLFGIKRSIFASNKYRVKTIGSFVLKASQTLFYDYYQEEESKGQRPEEKENLPPVRFELTTPGLRDQCSTTELKRPGYLS